MPTYLELEQSPESAEPVELFKFIYGNEIYAYSSGVDEVVHDGVTYLPAPMQHNGTQVHTEMIRNMLDITTDKNNTLAVLFIPGSPTTPISVSVFRKHNTSDGFITVYRGRITKCSFNGFEATLTAEPIATSLKRAGLRRVYETTCTHGIYDKRCGVLKQNYAQAYTVTFLDRRKLFLINSAISVPHGYYVGGILSFDGIEHMIAEHREPKSAEITKYSIGGVARHVLVLSRHIVQEGNVTEIVAYPGCDLTTTLCRERFNNLPNHGGFPYLPTTNPFVGDSVQW